MSKYFSETLTLNVDTWLDSPLSFFSIVLLHSCFAALAALHVTFGVLLLYRVMLSSRFARPSACDLRMRGIFGPRSVVGPFVVWHWLARSWSAWIFIFHAVRWLLCALSVLLGAGFLRLCVRRFWCSSLCGGLSVLYHWKEEKRREKEENGKEEQKRGFKM